MQAIALRHRPHAVCLVPEKREERTTEGGLEVAQDHNRLAQFIAPLREAGCRVSIFIAADRRQIEAAHRIGAPVVELHTGAYCEADLPSDAATSAMRELARLTEMAALAPALGLEVHAGHGLTYDNVAPIAALPEVMELNIGHFLIGEAIFIGLDAAIRRMRAAMDAARSLRSVEATGGARMILGIGNDLRNIERIGRDDRAVRRRGSCNRVFTETEQAPGRSGGSAQWSSHLCQALGGQGGLLQGARHRTADGDQVAGHGGREPALGPADDAADRLGGGAARGDDAGRPSGACPRHADRRSPLGDGGGGDRGAAGAVNRQGRAGRPP